MRSIPRAPVRSRVAGERVNSRQNHWNFQSSFSNCPCIRVRFFRCHGAALAILGRLTFTLGMAGFGFR